MIPRIILICFSAITICCLCAPASAVDTSIVVLIDGKQETLDRPLVLRGQVLVWVRDFERLGWGKVRIGDDGDIVLERDGLSIAYFPGRKTALINNLAVEMPFAPVRISDRVLVPLHFTARAFGYDCTASQALVVNIQRDQQTSPPKSPDAVAAQGIITGRVTYDGKPVEGIILRTVDDDGNFVPGVSAESDSFGAYSFRQLPPGRYHVYAYVGDNPDYFNRRTEAVRLEKDQHLEVDPLVLGRVLSPVSPLPGERAIRSDGKVSFAWTECPGAAHYELSIHDAVSGRLLKSHRTEVPSALVRLDLQAGRTYHWRVQALNGKGEYLGGSPGTGGEPWTFSLQD